MRRHPSARRTLPRRAALAGSGLLRRPSAKPVERLPQAFSGEAEPNLASRAHCLRVGDVDRLQPALTQLAEAGNRKRVDLMAFGLEPVARSTALVETSTSL